MKVDAGAFVTRRVSGFKIFQILALGGDSFRKERNKDAPPPPYSAAIQKLVMVLLVGLSLGACAKPGAKKMKSYPDGEAGLAALMTDLSAAANAGDDKLALAMSESLVMKDAKTWFPTTFGDSLGASLA